MITMFDGSTANIAWRNAAEKFQDKQNVQHQSSRAGQTREILHAVFTIKDPRQRWVTIRNPGINPAFAIAEWIWIMRGRRDAAFILPWNQQFAQYAGNSPDYHGAYGYRLRHNLGIDQIDQAYQALSGNPESRQVVLQIWDSRIDLPYPNGKPRDPDIPCNVVSLLKVRDGKLEWTQILRSNDLFRGVPYNFIQFTTIQEVIAGWLGIDVGTYHHFSDSLHVYESDLESVSSFRNYAEERNTDSLRLQKADFDLVIDDLGRLTEDMASQDLSPKLLEKTAQESSLPIAYHNLLLLLAAEAARRRRWSDMVEGLMWGCTNPMLIQAWFSWISRFKSQGGAMGPQGNSNL